MLTIQSVANCAFVPKVFPKSQFDFPADAAEQFGDHHLIHFHSGVIPNEDPNLTDKRTMFRQKVRQKPKLGHYCALKRSLRLAKDQIYNCLHLWGSHTRTSNLFRVFSFGERVGFGLRERQIQS